MTLLLAGQASNAGAAFHRDPRIPQALALNPLFLSGEMSVTRVMERALAIEGRVAIDDIRNGSLDDESSPPTTTRLCRSGGPGWAGRPWGGVPGSRSSRW